MFTTTNFATMTFAAWQQSGQIFRYREKYDIFYQTAGSGPPVLLLHGFPTASWDWWKVWPILSKQYQIIAFDFIGFGFSDKPARYDYTIHDQADIAEGLLRQLGVTSYHCLAHDYGDSVAQELLARHYERQDVGNQQLVIQSLALLNGGIFPQLHRARFIQRALASPIGFLLSPLLNRKKLHRNFQAIFGPHTQPNEQEIDEFWQLIAHKKGQNRAHQLIQYIRDRKIHAQRWYDATTRVALPQCLINGTFDPISGGHVVDYYEQVVDQPITYRLENIGHYPQTEAPEKVLEAYFDFREQ